METISYLLSTMTKLEALVSAVLFVLFIVSLGKLISENFIKVRNKKKVTRSRSSSKRNIRYKKEEIYA